MLHGIEFGLCHIIMDRVLPAKLIMLYDIVVGRGQGHRLDLGWGGVGGVRWAVMGWGWGWAFSFNWLTSLNVHMEMLMQSKLELCVCFPFHC